MSVLHIAVIVLGVALLLPGLVSAFRPERVAKALTWAPESPVGVVAIRVLIGAPYLAMGAMTLLAVTLQKWDWLAPVAAIEGTMAVIRLVSGFIHGFKAARLPLVVTEAFACLVLGYAAIQYG